MTLNKRLFQIILSLILIVLCNSCASIHNMDKVIVDRRLLWSDFNGKVPEKSEWDSECWFDVKLEYSNIRIENGKTVFDFTDWPYLNGKSWVRPSAVVASTSEELLTHEIGHYNIAKVWARELRMTLKNTTFIYRYCEQRILKIDEDLRKKYLAMEDQYDNETNHSRNKTQQVFWNAKIRKLMNAYL